MPRAVWDALQEAADRYSLTGLKKAIGPLDELKSIIERALIESGGATIQEHPLHLLNEKTLTRSTSLPGTAAAAVQQYQKCYAGVVFPVDPESNSITPLSGAGGAQFATTHWSIVVAAGKTDIPQAALALEKLCRAYWYPIYAYVRRRGYGPEDAQDLTQGFFARLLEQNYPAQADRAKGKFRSFLLLRLNHFLSDERERATARKRGGGQSLISLDDAEPEERYGLEITDGRLSPEKLFERRWAQTILEQALEQLRGEYARQNRGDAYTVLKAFEPGEQETVTYQQAAARLGVTESAVKSMIYRLRKRHRELVREQIAQTVSTEAEVDEELRHLLAVVSE